jgi:hypothetical protein
MTGPSKWWTPLDRPLTEDLDPDSAPQDGESWKDLQNSKEPAR